MKNILIKFRDGLIFGLGLFTVLGITHAAVNLTAINGESLTITKWNTLIDKVSGIYTDSNGNVGIGTESPQNIFSVFRGTPYETAGDTLDSYSIVDFTAKTNEDGVKRGLTIGAPTSNILSPVFLKVTGTSNRMGFLNQFNNESMSILDNGNVGIGTNNPTSKFEVTGGESRLETARIMAPGIGNCRIQVKNACHTTETSLHTSNGVSLCIYCYTE